jgi:hypothetical protein
MIDRDLTSGSPEGSFGQIAPRLRGAGSLVAAKASIRRKMAIDLIGGGGLCPL